MVTIEALNALQGDCLLLRYTGPDGKEKLWLVDGGPKAKDTGGGKKVTVWKEVLLPRLKQLFPQAPVTVHLGMVSHIDDDHINGIQKITRLLVNAGPGDDKPVRFERFWFNSFLDIVGHPAPGAHPSAMPMAVAGQVEADLSKETTPPELHDYLHTSEAVVQSVGQGNDLAADLGSLGLNGNQPVNGLVSAKKGQPAFNILGAMVTIVGPRADRLEALRKAWAKAVAEADAKKRKAELQELFLPTKKLDKSVPNLSSIVVLVVVEGKRLLLTGDALGDDIAAAWDELDLGDGTIDLLKMPHHGSIRNCSEKFIRKFPATHYLFSADGEYDNPDGPTVEGVVKLNKDRAITLHFTNSVKWETVYTTDKSNKQVATLRDLIDVLRTDYPGPWDVSFRDPKDFSLQVKLA